MDDVVNLSNEELKDIGVNKLKHRKLITQETQKMRKKCSSAAAAVSAKPIEKEPEEDISNEKPVMMITRPEFLVITSKGGASKLHGEVLGQFKYEADSEYYVQTSTEQSHENFQAVYMYQDSDNCWWVWTTPGEKKGALRNPRTNSEGLPENGHWQYADGTGTWPDDETLTVSPGPLPPLPRLFTVRATGSAAYKWPSYLGVFTRTQRWWLGRPVYTNTQGRLLHHGAGDDGWVIGPALGRYVLRGSRARDSPVTEDSWRYWTGTGVEYKPASVTVTGSD